MAIEQVFRYRVYNAGIDDYVESTRMATREKIERIHGEIIAERSAVIDDAFLTDGWTDKNFDPAAHQMHQTRSGDEGGPLPRR